jgi:hypothetical protein
MSRQAAGAIDRHPVPPAANRQYPGQGSRTWPGLPGRPLFPRGDVGAKADGYHGPSLLPQHAQGLARGHFRDSGFLAYLLDPRKPCPRREFAADDPGPQLAGDLLVGRDWRGPVNFHG